MTLQADTHTQPFTVVIPARLASSRLPNKPLADIGGVPMVVRVAQRAQLSLATQVVVAADHASIVQACKDHRIQAILTRDDHPSGSDRLAEACVQLGLADDAWVVNVQGDEPLMNPELINHVAALLGSRPEASMSTAAHAIDSVTEFTNPNVVKVVLDARQLAMYFSRAPIPWWRDGNTQGLTALPSPAPLRHIGIYGYRAGFLKLFPTLPQAPVEIVEALEQMRALWHGHKIAVHITGHAPGPGVDTPEDLQRVRSLWPQKEPL
jgi:3-deoxy-manno-octulosonate cytidylyltransferase (CMP-KDO synthetase)